MSQFSSLTEFSIQHFQFLGDLQVAMTSNWSPNAVLFTSFTYRMPCNATGYQVLFAHQCYLLDTMPPNWSPGVIHSSVLFTGCHVMLLATR